MLAKSKLNSIKTVVSQALINLEISHEEFVIILKEKKKYEKMKENVKNVSKKQENMRLKCQFKDIIAIIAIDIIDIMKVFATEIMVRQY